MERIEIETIRREITLRRLKQQVITEVRKFRPGLSQDTVYRAFKCKDYDKATILIQEILTIAKKVVAESKAAMEEYAPAGNVG